MATTFLEPKAAAERFGVELAVEREGRSVLCSFRELDGFVWRPVLRDGVLIGYERSVDTIGLMAKGGYTT